MRPFHRPRPSPQPSPQGEGARWGRSLSDGLDTKNGIHVHPHPHSPPLETTPRTASRAATPVLITRSPPSDEDGSASHSEASGQRQLQHLDPDGSALQYKPVAGPNNRSSTASKRSASKSPSSPSSAAWVAKPTNAALLQVPRPASARAQASFELHRHGERKVAPHPVDRRHQHADQPFSPATRGPSAKHHTGASR